MFTRRDDAETAFIELIDGISIRTLVHGERTLTAEFRLRKGSILPLHRHPHEQTGYLLSGRMIFVVDGERFEAGAGDSWCIRGNCEHGAEVVDDAVVIEVFSPVREDYLADQLARRRAA